MEFSEKTSSLLPAHYAHALCERLYDANISVIINYFKCPRPLTKQRMGFVCKSSCSDMQVSYSNAGGYLFDGLFS